MGRNGLPNLQASFGAVLAKINESTGDKRDRLLRKGADLAEMVVDQALASGNPKDAVSASIVVARIVDLIDGRGSSGEAEGPAVQVILKGSDDPET